MKSVNLKKDVDIYKFKYDKISDYFKFLITIQLVIFGYVFTAIDKISPPMGLNWLYPIIAGIVALSIVIALYGKIVLVKSMLEDSELINNQVKICYMLSGVMLISVIFVAVIRVW